MKKEISILFFVLMLGSVSGGMLVAVNSYTKPKIVKNKKIELKSNILLALGIDFNEKNIEEIFRNNIEVFEKKGFIFYKTKNNEIAFEFSGSGLWGPISGIIALKKDLKTIKDIRILHQEETPGLGGRISEKSFLKQFKDKKIFPELLILKPGKAKRENEVDGITGATITSKSFEKLLNKCIKERIQCLKK